VLPEVLPAAAVMVVLPTLRSDVARPVLSIVATDVSDELQVTCVVMSWLVPSAYVPVAVNCKEYSKGMIGSLGVTDIKTRGTAATMRFVLPETLPVVAIMVVEPAETAVASPVVLTVAIDGFNVLQVTCVVISKLVVPEYVPVAVNC